MPQMVKPQNKHKWHHISEKLSNQSAFHEAVRDILLKDPFFSALSVYQEVPVVDLVPNYANRSHRYDLYIDEIKTVVELHGEQHYKPTAFGSGLSYNEVMANWLAMQKRDLAKRAAAEEAGYKYVEIPYKAKRKLNAELLKELILRSN